MIIIHIVCIEIASLLFFRLILMPTIYPYISGIVNANQTYRKSPYLYAAVLCIITISHYYMYNGDFAQIRLNLLFSLLINGIFLSMAITDISVRKIPNRLCIYLAIAGVFALPDISGCPERFLFILAIAGICLALSIFSSGVGGGDLKMLMAAAIPLSFPIYISSLFWASVIIVIVACIGFISKKLHRKSLIPFAPFMAAGVFITTCLMPFI